MLLFDVGAGATPTAAPANNIVEAQATIANATDTTGSATGISVATAGFNGSNTNGTLTPSGAAAIFDANSTRDSLYGNTALFNSVIRPSATLTFTGLDATGATAYSFDFFASRTGVADNRETEYAVAGSTTVSAFLNASANVSEITSVSNMIPAPGGIITLTVDPGPNNNNATGFYYLGAFRLTTVAVPEPSAAGLRRRRSAR